MRSLIIPTALALVTTGCVSSGDIELLHREITGVSRQVENLHKSVARDVGHGLGIGFVER